jgi:cardiolipin synthase (CMP-forming)
MARPLITANQVTLLRIVLMPVPCWLLYGSPREQYAALVLATLLGCTDFIDGYLARKHGPTVLGGLMDPIADKVFIAIAFMPSIDLGLVPAWLVAALFAREFLVTAARSIYEKRGRSLKSTYLARYKTWVQMCGAGLLLMLATLPQRSMAIVLGVLAGSPVVGFALLWLVARKRWKGASWFAVSFGAMFALYRFTDAHVTAVGAMAMIVGVTWLSGLGYLLSIGQLRGRGPITVGEVARLVSAAALPCLIILVQASPLAAPRWALIALCSLEMAHGGLDNLLSHHHAEAGFFAWAARTFSECVLLGWVLLAHDNLATQIGCATAFAIGVVGLVIAFAQNRRFYLEPKAPATKAEAAVA